MTTATIVADPEVRDVLAYQVGVDIWAMPLSLACATLRGWLISRAAGSGEQGELDRIRIDMGYLKPTAQEHFKTLTVQEQLDMARDLQKKLLAQQTDQNG